MERIDNYDEIVVSEAREQLKLGGHECIIKNVKHFEYNSIKRISLEIDILDDNYKDFYQKKYDERKENSKYWDDGATISFPEKPVDDKEKSQFKGLITAIESYNPTYKWNWDENTLKGLKINCNFSLKEYEGNDGKVYTKPQISRFINSKENYKPDYIPKVKLLDGGYIEYEDYQRNKNNPVARQLTDEELDKFLDNAGLNL